MIASIRPFVVLVSNQRGIPTACLPIVLTAFARSGIWSRTVQAYQIANVMHISNLRNVIQERWTYEDAGILDRTHVRFLTLKEIDDMLQNEDYSKREYCGN